MNINFWRFWQKDASEVTYYTQETEVVASEPVAEYQTSHAYREKSDLYHKIVRWVVYLGAFLIPLFFLPTTTGILELNKQILLVVLAGVGLVVWLLGVVVSGQLFLRTNSVDKGLGAILLGTILATVFSMSRTRSIFGLSTSLSDSLLTVLALTVFYFLIVNVLDDQGKKLRSVLSSSIIVALLYGIAQMFTFYIYNHGFAHSRAFNTVGSPNALGLLAAVALPLLNRIQLRFHRLPYVDFAKLGVVAAVVVLAVLNWWVLWLVAIIGMLVTIALDSLAVAKMKSHGFRVARFLLPMTVIVLAVFLMIVNFNINSVKKNLPLEIAPSYGLSSKIVKSVLGKDLLFGFGPENFSMAFDRFGAKSLSSSTFSNIKFYDSTSQFFNYVVHGGLIMVLAFIFFLWVLVEVVLESKRNHVLVSPDFVGIFSAVVALVFGMFFYPLNMTLMFILYCFLGLMVLNVWNEKRHWDIEEKPVVSLASSLGFIVGLITVLAGAYFSLVQYWADATYAKALNEKNGDTTVNLLVKAINLDNQDDRFYRAASQAALSLLSGELNKNANDAQRASRIQNYIVSAIDLAKKGTAVDPYESNNWANLGNVYQNLIGLVDGVDKLAEESYLKAEDLRPGDPSIANTVGSMYLGESDLVRQLARSAGVNAPKFKQAADNALVQSEKYFKKAVELSPNYGLAIYSLGAVYSREGKLSDAIKQLEKIIPYNADQANLVFELGLLYYRAGRKDDAFAALQRAVFLSPTYANARWYLALIYEERRDLASAIDQLEKILETNAGNQTVLDKLDQLRAGKTTIPPAKVIDQKPL